MEERQTGQYGMVVPWFIKAALLDKPIEVYGDGKQTRCFTYVRDVVEGMLALANDSTAYGDIYNIGSKEEISIEDPALMFKDIVGSNSEIQYIRYEEVYGYGFDDMRRRVPSLEKIHRQIGYKPKTSLRTTLEIISEYYRK